MYVHTHSITMVLKIEIGPARLTVFLFFYWIGLGFDFRLNQPVQSNF